MAQESPELLNAVYREISEKLGMDAAMEIYHLYHQKVEEEATKLKEKLKK